MIYAVETQHFESKKKGTSGHLTPITVINPVKSACPNIGLPVLSLGSNEEQGDLGIIASISML